MKTRIGGAAQRGSGGRADRATLPSGIGGMAPPSDALAGELSGGACDVCDKAILSALSSAARVVMGCAPENNAYTMPVRTASAVSHYCAGSTARGR